MRNCAQLSEGGTFVPWTCVVAANAREPDSMAGRALANHNRQMAASLVLSWRLAAGMKHFGTLSAETLHVHLPF